MKSSTVFIAFLSAVIASAETTVSPAMRYAYGANIGWINGRGDGANGLAFGQAFCSGFMYSANCGWINFGDGDPADGVAYANDSAADFGVNHDGQGNLSGFAWGANIGWITFEQSYGQPRVNLETGELTGFAYGANVGWIDFSSLATLSLVAPDSDGDGIADAWERSHAEDLEVLADGGQDSDHDGVSDVAEYSADTDPFDSKDFLRITAFDVASATNVVTWTSRPTRLYTLQRTGELEDTPTWKSVGAGFVPPAGPHVSKVVADVTDSNRFYRVVVDLPLAP